MPDLAAWQLRQRTLRAMVLLAVARLVVALLPFRWWRGTLGQHAVLLDDGQGSPGPADGAARRIALHVERGAARLPFATKCLPRAMATCWMLRAADIGYAINIAARPRSAQAQNDNLHAWVDSGGGTVIGEMPGPWLVVLVLHG